jgi:hypothetical protein
MKSDLLKEAIADAKAVKETALANAKMALEEAFTPKLQSMLSHKIAEELEEEDEEEVAPEMDAMTTDEPVEDEMATEEDEMATEEDEEMYSEEGEEDMEMDMDSEEDGEEYDVTGDEEEETEEDDLDLEAVIRELEDAMAGEEEVSEEDEMGEEPVAEEEMEDEPVSEEEEELDINEIIKALQEMDGEEEEPVAEEEESTEGYKEELEEAYKVITSLKKTINEVNLLNAKLLYTNKLFRTFDLNENQKMKVIENFDRAASLREVKLVYATLGENLNVARKNKTVVKESLASKPMKSSAPKKEIISEGTAVAERFKKLAGLIK